MLCNQRMSSTKSITLKPSPGFCVKSSTLQPALYTLPSPVQPDTSVLQTVDPTIPIPIGYKVFINIAWDPNVPAPPLGSEDAIHSAMKGEDVDKLNPDGWYVPVVVSEGRPDKDKGTCSFHSLTSPPLGSCIAS